MKSKRKEEPYPLQLVNDFKKKDDQIWNILESLRIRDEKENDGRISTLALAEISGAYLSYKKNAQTVRMTKNQTMSFGLEIASLFRWRKDKILLDYDPDMATELYEQANDLKIPSKILKSLPYDCFYMTLPGIHAASVFGYENTSVHGVFVTRERSERPGRNSSVPAHPESVRFCIVGDKGSGENTSFAANFLIDINDKSIEENLPFNIINGHNDRSRKTDIKEIGDLYRKILTLVLYTCARNKDISRKPGTEKRTKRTGEIKDKYYEVEEYDVGARVAAALRIDVENASLSPLTDGMEDPRYIAVNESDTPAPEDASLLEDGEDQMSSKTKRKAAHIRRGHWHHYWTGPRNNPENRIPILHWLPPTAVGIMKEEAKETTIKPITRKRKIAKR